MKLSDKFANLGPGGLARRIVKETASDQHGRSSPPATERGGGPPLAPDANNGAGATKDGGKGRGTGKQDKFDRTAYQREYMRKRRAKIPRGE